MRPGRKPLPRDEKPGVLRKRMAEIESAWRSGLTLQQIGDIYGVTREYIRQLLREYGIAPKTGGQTRRSAIRQAKADATRESRYYAKYGMSRAEYRAIPSKLRGAYRRQKQSAHNRGIAFTIALPDWYAIWVASGKIEQRGRGKGYCMARIRDAGGYEVGNVFITTGRENAAEYMRSRWSGKRKDSCTVERGIWLIYPGTNKPYVAVVGGVNKHFATVEDARAAIASRPSPKGWTIDDRCKLPYRAQINVAGRCVTIGRFNNPDEAHQAYVAYRAELVA